MKIKHSYSRQATVLGLSALFTTVSAMAVTDFIGPPPDDDPSAFTEPLFGNQIDGVNLQDSEPPMEGALEVTGGQHADAGINNGLTTGTQAEVEGGGGYDVPTGAAASPMFGAQPFTQQMMRFEEFGNQKLDPTTTAGTAPFPMPTTGPAPSQDPFNSASSQPETGALDSFLNQAGMFPFPTEFSNILDPSPWTSEIESFLGRALDGAPMEGRPGGRGWAHQRWNEFYPQSFFKTAHAGSRPNGGIRDKLQLHNYTAGEFGPGGLYHNTAGAPVTEGTTGGINIAFHPNMPLQDHKSLWTFDGTLPPKLLMARVGEPLVMRHFNALPIDPTANRGFGLHTISTHEHNGHNPAESDGFANAFFFPGQYYDYRWPMQIAGYDSINTTATDNRASFPCATGETLFVNDLNPGVKTCENGLINVRGDHREIMSTHWFHDHMLDFTAQNVYKGNAAMMNYYSGKDRGNESVDDGVNLRFPSGSSLPWGNRDYDVNLVMADKAWDQEGQLWFNIFNLDGFLGDVMTTNWLYKPFMDVRARSYRFRLLNGSVSRYMKVALVHEVAGRTTGEINGTRAQGVSWNRVPFHMVANDGNIMEHAVAFDGATDLDNDGNKAEHKGTLPVQAIAERYDIIVDFSKHGIQPGDKLYFVNLLEHKNGKVVEGPVALGQVLRGGYKATLEVDKDTGIASWEDADPVVGKFLELRVQAYDGVDQSMDPADYEPGKLAMTELPWDRNNAEDVAAIQNARHRTYDFGRSQGTDNAPWTIKADGSSGLTADTRRLSAAPQLATGPTEAGFSGDGTREVWQIKTGGGWSHPIHIHFEEGIIISKDGELPPAWEIGARKDVFRLGPEEDAGRDMEIAYHFREFAGSFVEHCHNTQHEDHAMLLRWDLEHPGQVKFMPAVLPTWDGVEYIDTVALPTIRTGDGIGPQVGIPTL
ncbi:MAG: multicopper oxidase domain-containing protein [Motiliproteus sp.]